MELLAGLSLEREAKIMKRSFEGFTLINDDEFLKWYLENSKYEVIDADEVLRDVIHNSEQNNVNFDYEISGYETKSKNPECYYVRRITKYFIGDNVKYTVEDLDFKDENGNPCDYPEDFIENEEYDRVEDVLIF
jgi:hypothetical protein